MDAGLVVSAGVAVLALVLALIFLPGRRAASAVEEVSSAAEVA